VVRIVGSALPSRINVHQEDFEESQFKRAEEYEVRKTKTRTLLTNKKEMRSS